MLIRDGLLTSKLWFLSFPTKWNQSPEKWLDPSPGPRNAESGRYFHAWKQERCQRPQGFVVKADSEVSQLEYQE